MATSVAAVEARCGASHPELGAGVVVHVAVRGRAGGTWNCWTFEKKGENMVSNQVCFFHHTEYTTKGVIKGRSLLRTLDS